ncbi:hypothetical protein [Acidovorax sp. sic0104]|uniref:hypothetical protein n=1 Tax=Acidovorax sp. sic0104 TaxID=2854784 RepID=UPI001C444220|nr:hypothetical protein [Acidovorax sp. sic0104]MBV7542085.1 hypothetical protein [Acidovorax sp. sic0104]
MMKSITRHTRTASKALRSWFLVCCLIAGVVTLYALTRNMDVSLSISPTHGLNFRAVQPNRVGLTPGSDVKPPAIAVAAPSAVQGANVSAKE